jgi:serine/threonine protein kinase
MNALHVSHTSSTEESQLVELVEEITARLQAGDVCDVEDYAARFPEYADRLRDWMTVMAAMADLGHSLAVGAASRAAPVESQSPLDGPTPGILGDFRILRELGRGGMGIVYEAEQISIGRRVALKVLPFAAMLDRQQLNRFKNEARAAGTLDHPNIVAIYSVGCERGVHYYAMQLIEGQSLAQVIDQLRRVSSSGVVEQRSSGAEPAGDCPNFVESAEQNGTVPFSPAAHTAPNYSTPVLLHSPSSSDTTPIAALSTLKTTEPQEFFRTAAQLGIQAAEALDHAHASGILHRDIKPANLLVECSGISHNSGPKLWITDFGLARIELDAGLTMTGDIVGTLRYMSPEQALARRAVVDHRSDIYSLGVTLYELLAGRPAIDSSDRGELLRAIAEVDPLPLRKLAPKIPADLETIVHKAIEKDAADRYSTAKELSEDLRRFIEDKPILVTPPTISHRLVKWSRRHRPFVRFATLLLAVSVVGLSVSTALVLRERREAIRQRDQAEANFRQAHKAIATYFSAVDQNETLSLPGLHPLRERLLASAIDTYKDFGRSHPDDRKIQAELAATYFRLAWIKMSMELNESGIATMQEGMEIVNRLMNGAPDDINWQVRLAGVYSGDRFFHKSAYADPVSARQAVRALGEVTALWEKLQKLNPKVTALQSDVANLHSVLGDMHLHLGEELVESLPTGAIPSYQTALGLWTELDRQNAEQIHYWQRLEACRGDLAALLTRTGMLADADLLLREMHGKHQPSPGRIGPVLNPANDHYYEFVADDSESWLEARANAEALTLQDDSGNVLRGYLATVTSEQEQRFLIETFATDIGSHHCEDVWLGASDAAVEGEWRWVTGPEAFADGGRGQLFWVGNPEGAAVSYQHWVPGVEPNDFLWESTDVGEDFLAWNHRPKDYSGLNCYWNDSPNIRLAEPVGGYFIEYGGLGAVAADAYIAALSHYEKLIAAWPERVDSYEWYALALLQLAAGRNEDYRRTCSQMLERFQGPSAPITALHVVRTCVLSPSSVPDVSVLIRMATRAQGRHPTDTGYLESLGAAFYRAGKLQDALKYLRQAIGGSAADVTSKATTSYFLAMTYGRLGDAQQGRAWLNTANEAASDSALQAARASGRQVWLPWDSRLNLCLLRQEAEAMLGMLPEPGDAEKAL